VQSPERLLRSQGDPRVVPGEERKWAVWFSILSAVPRG
jgi:hypothetical protein